MFRPAPARYPAGSSVTGSHARRLLAGILRDDPGFPAACNLFLSLDW